MQEHHSYNGSGCMILILINVKVMIVSSIILINVKVMIVSSIILINVKVMIVSSIKGLSTRRRRGEGMQLS